MKEENWASEKLTRGSKTEVFQSLLRGVKEFEKIVEKQ